MSELADRVQVLIDAQTEVNHSVLAALEAASAELDELQGKVARLEDETATNARRIYDLELHLMNENDSHSRRAAERQAELEGELKERAVELGGELE